MPYSTNQSINKGPPKNIYPKAVKDRGGGWGVGMTTVNNFVLYLRASLRSH